MIRGTLLIIWGWIVLWSVISGRLDLLLRGVFHGLVGVSGAALFLAGVVLVIRQRGPPELAFVLPTGQRTLTEWVRLLLSQQDPDLVDGNPVNISGFVWTQRNGPPLIARLTVRCCLADATPAGLAVDWPDGFEPTTNQWLAIQGEMAVTMRNEQRLAVVIPKTITPIPRPKRPLEP